MRLIENTCALLSIILLLVCGRDSANSNPVGEFLDASNCCSISAWPNPNQINVCTLGTGGPSVVTEGKDALLTCVIMGLFENDTVIWRRGSNEILAAGTNRVTQDRRISVLHDERRCNDSNMLSSRNNLYGFVCSVKGKVTIGW